MGIHRGQILPRITGAVSNRRELAALRSRVCAGLDGQVPEIGFGSGLNVPRYPPAMARVQAADPATAGRKLAARRVAASPVPAD